MSDLYGVDEELPEDLDTEPDEEVPVGPKDDPTTADEDDDAA